MIDFARIRELRGRLASLEDRARFKMDQWFVARDRDGYLVENEDDLEDLEEGFCNTSACLAGHAWLMFDPVENPVLEARDTDIFARGRDLLGLDDGEACYMFYGTWHAHVTSCREITVEEAVRYLDRVLEVGSVRVRI